MLIIPTDGVFAGQILLLGISSGVVNGAFFLYMFLWFYFTMRCSHSTLCMLHMEILWSLGSFSPEQVGIWFCRYSPGSLSQIYSFRLCVCHWGSVNSGCHPLRRQVYHYVFSREYFSSFCSGEIRQWRHFPWSSLWQNGVISSFPSSLGYGPFGVWELLREESLMTSIIKLYKVYENVFMLTQFGKKNNFKTSLCSHFHSGPGLSTPSFLANIQIHSEDIFHIIYKRYSCFSEALVYQYTLSCLWKWKRTYFSQTLIPVAL